MMFIILLLYLLFVIFRLWVLPKEKKERGTIRQSKISIRRISMRETNSQSGCNVTKSRFYSDETIETETNSSFEEERLTKLNIHDLTDFDEMDDTE